MNAPEAPPRASAFHWTQLANGGSLLLLAALALAGARACLRAGWALAPLALLPLIVAALAGWGAAIQLSGGARMDDHPWV